MEDTQTIWQQLESAASQEKCLSELFAEDANRGERYRLTTCDLYFDYSKQLIDDDVLDKLFHLANERSLRKAIADLHSGESVNLTEQRAALHSALRLPESHELFLDGKDINQDVHSSLNKAEQISNQIRSKVWRGFSGEAITDVVNIGVGGSDLGPLMAVTALDDWADSSSVNLHFISNMDGTQLAKVLKNLNPQTTLFIVSSKSFSTVDTFSNAETALAWMAKACDQKAIVLKNHFLAVSASEEKMDAWGLPKSNQLIFWEWVGGRFSMWSSIGLAIAIKLGMNNFKELLAGAHDMDVHFANADFRQNLPVILGLVGVWNSTFLKINAHTVLPYDGRLKYFPNYLMQLEMESNGKSVDREGRQLNYDTAPVMWGDVGSNGQHAFYQLLHQGTQRVSCDFIAPIRRYAKSESVGKSLTKQHHLALANCLAQSRVLAFGNRALDPSKQSEAHKNHKVYRGNQPSSTILLNRLTPRTLGALIAAYEHKVYVMSVIWETNPFDQWGVEIGKVMANQLSEAMSLRQFNFDSSTNALLSRIVNG